MDKAYLAKVLDGGELLSFAGVQSAKTLDFNKALWPYRSFLEMIFLDIFMLFMFFMALP